MIERAFIARENHWLGMQAMCYRRRAIGQTISGFFFSHSVSGMTEAGIELCVIGGVLSDESISDFCSHLRME